MANILFHMRFSYSLYCSAFLDLITLERALKVSLKSYTQWWLLESTVWFTPCIHRECNILTTLHFPLENTIVGWAIIQQIWIGRIYLLFHWWYFVQDFLSKLLSNLFYSGHKWYHGIKLKTIVTPASLFASMHVWSCEWELAWLISSVEEWPCGKLQHFMPEGTIEHRKDWRVDYICHGDPAYPQSIHIFGGYRNPLNGSAQALWNSGRSKGWEVVE